MTQTSLARHERAFLSLLNICQVEYLVIRGYAVAYHGYHRPIADLDKWIATRRHNAQKMVTVLRAFGHGLPLGAEAFFELPERVIRIGTPPFRIEHYQSEDRFIHLGRQPPQLEVMTSISGVEFTQCYPGRVTDDLDGVLVNFISLSCLIRNKQASIRPKDADDYEHLMESQAGTAQLGSAPQGEICDLCAAQHSGSECARLRELSVIFDGCRSSRCLVVPGALRRATATLWRTHRTAHTQ